MSYTFGLELEFKGSSQSRVVEALTRRGIVARAANYTSNAAEDNAWLIKPDGSCEWEAVSPVMSLDEALRVAPIVCQAIRDTGGDARHESCGFHIHVAGFSNAVKAVRNTARRFVNFEDTLDMLQPVTRRGNRNQYCKSNAALFGATPQEQTLAIWEKAQKASSLEALGAIFNPAQDRYYKINLQSLVRHGTLEIRHHGGTLDGETVSAWLAFVAGFVAVAENQERLWKRPAENETQADRFRKMMRGVPTWAAKRIRQRAARLNDADVFA